MTAMDYYNYFEKAERVGIDLKKVASQLRTRYPMDAYLINEALYHLGV